MDCKNNSSPLPRKIIIFYKYISAIYLRLFIITNAVKESNPLVGSSSTRTGGS